SACLLPRADRVVGSSRRRGRKSSSASAQRRPSPVSDLSVLRVPVALEVGDQRRAEVTIGLLARVNRGVAPEKVERLLAHSEGAAIADRADGARACEAFDDAVDCGVHLAGRRDLITNEAPFLAVTLQPALIEDGLSRHAIADEARQAQIREAR